MKNNQFFTIDTRLETRRLVEKILKKTNYAGVAYFELFMISQGGLKLEKSFFYGKKFKNRTITPPIELIGQLDNLVKKHQDAKDELKLFCSSNYKKQCSALSTREKACGIKPKSANKVPATIQENEEENNSDEKTTINQTNKYNQTLQRMASESSELSINGKQSSSATEPPKQNWFFTWCSWLFCCSPCLEREQSNEVVLQSNETANAASLKNTF